MGSSLLGDNFINAFNAKFTNFKLKTISGILMDASYNFTSIVEYYEYDASDNFLIDNHLDEISASIMLSSTLSLPLFILTYRKGDDFILINDFHTKTTFSKSFVFPDKRNSDFLQWWKFYKGTQQIKPFYREDYLNWKINEIFSFGDTMWGGDIDAVCVDLNRNIISLVEFRKSTKAMVSNYDPRDYYKGIGTRAGDANTWLPLTKLKKKLNVCLYLVTLSNIDTTSYGIAEILDSNNDDLYYKFNVSPKAMNTNVIENLFQIIINRKL